MIAYTVYLEQIPQLLRPLARDYEVLVPAKVADGFYDFVPWQEGVEIAWDYDLAYNTLKRYFLPPREDLIEYDLDSYTAKPVTEAPKRLLLGVHPYDLKGVNQLDQLMELGSPDLNYRARRDATVIFGMEPQTVATTAFWATIGAAQVDYGYDLYWTKISPAAFYVQVGSPLGEEMLNTNIQTQVATAAEREAARREQVRIRSVARKQGLKYPWEETPAVLKKSWNSPLWKEWSRLCLACGSCVTVCPTCYCFDVKEEVDDLLKTGRRYREWDGCMLEGFAAIAGGHNFRSKAWERYRHRFFRKGKYIYDKIGELGCIGCGRCVAACTANIASPVAVFNQLWEDTHHEK